MAHAAINTKIEQVVEAVESLALAAAKRGGSGSTGSFQDVIDAREELRHALAELLQPVLRVVN